MLASATSYLADHKVEEAIAAAVEAVIRDRPDDPIRAIAVDLAAQAARAAPASAMTVPLSGRSDDGAGVLTPKSRTSSVAQFRPCIDLHQGKVKQIVGSTLTDDPSAGPVTNFEATRPSEAFAEMYRRDGLRGRPEGRRGLLERRCHRVDR